MLTRIFTANQSKVVMICVDDMNAYATKKQYPLIQTPGIGPACFTTDRRSLLSE